MLKLNYRELWVRIIKKILIYKKRENIFSHLILYYNNLTNNSTEKTDKSRHK